MDSIHLKTRKTMSLPYFTPPNHHSSTLSNISEVYYSDSEGSKCLILPRSKTFLNDSDVENFNDFQRKTLATSSPLNNQTPVIKKYYKSYDLKRKNISNSLPNKTIKTNEKQNHFIKSNSLLLLKNKENNSIINNIKVKKKYSLQHDKLLQFKDHKNTKNHPTHLLKNLCLSNNNNTYNSANKIVKHTDLNRLEKDGKEKLSRCLESLDSQKTILSYNNDFEDALLKIFEIPEKMTEEDSINISAYNAVHSILINNSINIDINKKEDIFVNTVPGKVPHKSSHDFIDLKPKESLRNKTSISVPHKENDKGLISNVKVRKINEFNYTQKDKVLNSVTSNNNLNFNNSPFDMSMDTISDVSNAPDTNLGYFSTKYNDSSKLHKNNKDENISYAVNIIFDEKSKSDLTELLQLDLDLKMFEEKIVPYLNSLKSDMLGLMVNQKHIPTKCITRGSANVCDVLRNNKRCLSLKNINLNAMNIKKQLNLIEDIGCPKYAKFKIDKLNLLNSKLKTTDNLKKQFNFLFKNNQLKQDSNQNNSGESSLSSTGLLFSCPFSVNSIKALSPITNTETNDSFTQNRDDQKEYSVSPISNDVVNYSILSSKPELNNISLEKVSEAPIKKHSLLPVVVMDKNWSYNNQSNSSSTSRISNLQEVPENNDFLVDCNVVKNNRYWLRSTPTQTKRFVAPIRVTAIKKRNNRLKKNTNDIFILKGRGNSKSLVRYKAHSVVNTETKSFPKALLFKSKNTKHKQPNTSNTELFRPLINNCKPCACGIFKSQIPSCWTDKLHNILHENLYKLNFKPHESLEVVERVSQKEFSYDIIKTTNINGLGNKNVLKALDIYEEFINLELNFVKSTVGGKRDSYVYLAIHPNSTVVGYLKIETLQNACTLNNGKLTDNLVAVKYGVSKLWVMVSYRRHGIATKLLQRFRDDEKLSDISIAFAHHGSNGIEFINNYFSNNSILVY